MKVQVQESSGSIFEARSPTTTASGVSVRGYFERVTHDHRRDTHVRWYRGIVRYVNEAVLERIAERLAKRPELLNRRGECVEHPFGSIKQWMGQGAFLMRRLENVRGEFSLPALAYNMRRAVNLVGVPTLVAAARA